MASVARPLLLGALVAVACAQSNFFFLADNYCSIYLNGALVYTDNDWRITYGTVVMTEAQRPGRMAKLMGNP